VERDLIAEPHFDTVGGSDWLASYTTHCRFRVDSRCAFRCKASFSILDLIILKIRGLI